MRKNKVFQIRLTEEELETLKKLAHIECKGNVSKLIKYLIEDYKELNYDEI